MHELQTKALILHHHSPAETPASVWEVPLIPVAVGKTVGVQRWFRSRITAKYGRPACFQLGVMEMEED